MILFRILQVGDVGLRLDRYLVSQLPDYSRTKIQGWIKSGAVLVNNQVRKTGYALEQNDEISIQIPDPIEPLTDLEPERMDLDILFEDESIAIIDKPAGLVVHPGTGNRNGTLVNGLVHHFNSLSDVNGQLRPGIVHRLDADTSGLIIIAKTNSAHAFLADQFQKRQVQKKYTAIVWGIISNDHGEINEPIDRSRKDPTSYLVSPEGKSAITEYKVESKFRHLSQVSFFPKTGRTHQIRVHAAHLGFPIFGDEKYGGGLAKTRGFLPEFTQLYQKEMKKLNRHALHASRLEFTHPDTKKPIIFEAPFPSEFLNLINAIESFYDG